MLNEFVLAIMRLCVLHFDLCLLAVCQIIIALISDIIWIIYQGVIWMEGQWKEKRYIRRAELFWRLRSLIVCRF